MGNIITPKQVIRKRQLAWQNKSEKKGTQPTKLERTSETTFVVHHEDGSQFEGKVDPAKVKFAEDSRNTASRFHIPANVKLNNVMSNKDRRKMGLPEDPDLAD